MTDQLKQELVDFVKDEGLRRWIERTAYRKGFDTPSEYAEHLLKVSQALSNTHLQYNIYGDNDNWRELVEKERQEALKGRDLPSR